MCGVIMPQQKIVLSAKYRYIYTKGMLFFFFDRMHYKRIVGEFMNMSETSFEIRTGKGYFFRSNNLIGGGEIAGLFQKCLV